MIRATQELHTPEGAALTRLILTIFRANGRLMRAGDNLTHDFSGLTAARWQVLDAIKDEPKTVAQIAREFEFTRQGVLPSVQALVDSGIVERIHNPNHQRAQLIQLTKHGKKLYSELATLQSALVNEMALVFNSQELKRTNKLLERLSDEIKKFVDGAESF